MFDPRLATLLLLVSASLGTARLQEGTPVSEELDGQGSIEFDERERQRILKLSPLPELPLDSSNRFDGDERAERLGQFFFFDVQLSKEGRFACASCHLPTRGFSDDKPVAQGHGVGRRRTPALWNQAYGHWYFHDGRADTLWAQALAPLENELEMAGNRVAILRRIAREPRLRRAFEALSGSLPALEDEARFPAAARPTPDQPAHPHGEAWGRMASEDRVAVNRSFSDLGKMIAAYERRLVSRNAPFDRFVRGLREEDPSGTRAITPGAQRGLRLFLGKGRCRLCHNGPNFSDGEFHGLGLADRLGGMPTDPGRYEGVAKVLASEFNSAGAYSDDPDGERARQLTGLKVGPANWGEFKTPSLRNVGERAPYMHAGQFPNLASVLTFYSTLEGAAPLHQHQEQVLIARDFSEQEMKDLLEFLLSLQGASLDPKWMSAPSLDLLVEDDLPVPKEHGR